jgi:hypothetical protein
MPGEEMVYESGLEDIIKLRDLPRIQARLKEKHDAQKAAHLTFLDIVCETSISGAKYTLGRKGTAVLV